MDWKDVKAGDFFFIPAGTVHAIGAGLKLVEVQQNVDVTYRLYDYGSPRELHLEEGMVASKAEPYALPAHSDPRGIDARLMPGEPFGLEVKSRGRSDERAVGEEGGSKERSRGCQ